MIVGVARRMCVRSMIATFVFDDVSVKFIPFSWPVCKKPGQRASATRDLR